MPAAEGATILKRINPPPQIKDEAAQNPKRAIFLSLIWRWGGGGGADVGGIKIPSILSKIVVEVIEEKSLRQYIIFITIVPLFNTQHHNLF